MAGLVPANHVIGRIERPKQAADAKSFTAGGLCNGPRPCRTCLWSGAAWVAGTSPAMTTAVRSAIGNEAELSYKRHKQTHGFGRFLCYAACGRRARHQRDPEDRGDPGHGYRRIQPARGSGRGSHPGATQGAAQRSDRSDHRRASWSRRQAHRGRQPHRVPQRCRRGALRHRGAERPHRAQRRPAAGAPHRIPGRHSSGRCRRGGRRRPDGRRRQYRRAPGEHRRARRDLSVRGRLPSGERQARYGGHRSRPDAAQEHRKIDSGLFAAGGRPRPSEACDRA